ncbi:PQQ-binding-like beta-propeller repeat protein [Chloroflexota bacterium]
MKTKSALALLVLCALLVTGCAGGRFTASSGWAGPAVSEQLVYIGSRDGRVMALAVGTGDLRFSFPPQHQDPLPGLYGSPALADDQLFVGGYDGKLYALNAADLTFQWQYPADESQVGRIVGSPAVAGELVIFGSSDRFVRALRVADGSLAWSFQTEDRVWSTPTVAGDTVYISSLDHRVYALSISTGSPKWPVPFEADGAIVSSPLVADGKVFVGSFDRSFYTLDATSGTLLQRFDGDSWFWSSPISDGKRVYAASMSGKLYALDSGRGSIWRELFDLKNPVVTTPVLVDGRIVVTSDGGLIYTISPETGQQVAPAFNVGAEVRAPLAASDGTVYVNAMDRSVWAIRVVGKQEKVWQITTSDND